MSWDHAWAALDRAHTLSAEANDEALGRAIETAKDIIRARKGELTLREAAVSPPWSNLCGWVWYFSQCGGVDGAIEKARSLQMSGIFVKEADEGRRWWQVTPSVVARVKDKGLRLAAWTYLYGEDYRAAARAVIAIAKELGVDGVIVDAEAEVRDRPQTIEPFCAIVRDALPEAHLAVAPLPVMEYHRGLQYEVWMKYEFDFIPQFYTNVLPERFGLHYLFPRWAERFPMHRVYPAYGMYGRTGYRGDETARYPTAAQLREFWQMAQEYGCPGTSYWRLDTIDSSIWEQAVRL